MNKHTIIFSLSVVMVILAILEFPFSIWFDRLLIGISSFVIAVLSFVELSRKFRFRDRLNYSGEGSRNSSEDS